MEELNLAPIIAEWNQQCGSCDAGLPMTCTCPTGDPRVVIADLINEIRRLRSELAKR